MSANPSSSAPVSVGHSRAPSPTIDLSTNPDSILASLPRSGTFGSSLDLSLRNLTLDSLTSSLPTSTSTSSLPAPSLDRPRSPTQAEAQPPDAAERTTSLSPQPGTSASPPGISPTRHPLIRSVTAPVDHPAPLDGGALSPPPAIAAAASVARKAAPTRSVTASLEGEPAPGGVGEGEKGVERKSSAAGLLRQMKAMAVSTPSLAKVNDESEKKEEQPKPPPLVLEKMSVYETKTKLYVIATNQTDKRYQILEIDRTPAPISPHDPDPSTAGLIVYQDPKMYSNEEVESYMTSIAADRIVKVAYGIAGFIKFTSAYYMILITKRLEVGLIGGHYIYHAEETMMKQITLPSASVSSAEEGKRKTVFAGIDLTKNFYFSYTYDLTHTLQHNMTRPVEAPTSAFSLLDDKWVWNHHLLRPAFRREKAPSPWLLPLIHGFVDQAKLSIYGRTVHITTIARRSRHFAGARFLRRGVNDQGYVANDVETEQIVTDMLTTGFYSIERDSEGKLKPKLNPRFTSFVQVRGSIPVYWAQELQMTPKPMIDLTIIDPYFSAAALHFDDLLGRYGAPITVLSLIKQNEHQPREGKLADPLRECIAYLNQFLPSEARIGYQAFDVNAIRKEKIRKGQVGQDALGILEDISEQVFEKVGIFHSGPEPSVYSFSQFSKDRPYRDTPTIQTGTIRTNCVDCIDRTNTGQTMMAKVALGHQLHALGITRTSMLEMDCDAVRLLNDMHNDLGDTIALQYGGSALVNNVNSYRRQSGWTSHSKDMIENFRRYYANTFSDADKQIAIDLFLGVSSRTPPPKPKRLTTAPRRSYQEWFTPKHLDPPLEGEELVRRMLAVAEAEAENVSAGYWQRYYRPGLFTTFERHYAIKLATKDKYVDLLQMMEISEQSPFRARKTDRAEAPPPPSTSKQNQWIAPRRAQSNGRKQEKQTPPTHKEPEKVPAPPLNSTAALLAKLSNPVVPAEELQEYSSYVSQFDKLELGGQVGDKDKAIYTAAATIAKELEDSDSRVGAELLVVSQPNQALYAEAVRVGRAGQELKASLDRGE